MAKQAVLLLAHGTPETVKQIPEYLSYVTGGRPLPPEVVAEIQRRYALIGHSPLTEITLEQGRLVEAELADGGERARVYVGMRNWSPYIAEVVRQMRADGVEEAAVLCLCAAELSHQRWTLSPRSGDFWPAHRLHRGMGTASAAD